MKQIRTSAVLTPVAAILSALATLACCLPLGLGAAVGALGLSVIFARFQIWFLVLSVVLLLVGLIQLLRKHPNCRRRSRTEVVMFSIAAAVVLAIVLFPQWVAGLMAAHLL